MYPINNQHSNTLPATLQPVKAMAKDIFPHCPREFLTWLKQSFNGYTLRYTEHPVLSDEFVALCLWIHQLDFTSPGVSKDRLAILQRIAICIESKINQVPAEAQQCSDEQKNVAHEVYRPLVRRLANALATGFNLSQDNSLVVALGDGSERNNIEAVVTWVERMLVSNDLPAEDASIHRLISHFEQTLNAWSLQRFGD